MARHVIVLGHDIIPLYARVEWTGDAPALHSIPGRPRKCASVPVLLYCSLAALLAGGAAHNSVHVCGIRTKHTITTTTRVLTVSALDSAARPSPSASLARCMQCSRGYVAGSHDTPSTYHTRAQRAHAPTAKPEHRARYRQAPTGTQAGSTRAHSYPTTLPLFRDTEGHTSLHARGPARFFLLLLPITTAVAALYHHCRRTRESGRCFPAETTVSARHSASHRIASHIHVTEDRLCCSAGQGRSTRRPCDKRKRGCTFQVTGPYLLV